jgi:hypothetical protein
MPLSFCRIDALALALTMLMPIAVHAESAPAPTSAGQSPSIAALPPPTVLRGSPPNPARSVPICPPGYTMAPGYGCLAPPADDYSERGSGYDYWPYYGFDHGARRLHGFARSRGFARFHDAAGFHGSARFHSAGGRAGPIAGFGRR